MSLSKKCIICDDRFITDEDDDATICPDCIEESFDEDEEYEDEEY
jgi:hypothetical protein